LPKFRQSGFRPLFVDDNNPPLVFLFESYMLCESGKFDIL
jgi:hypothetical protein